MPIRAYRLALLPLLLAAFALFQMTPTAHACMCMPDEPEARFPTADVVFRGRVLTVDSAPAPYDPRYIVQTGLLVEVEDVFKGQAPSRVYFAYHSDVMCGGPPPFSAGKEYFFYTHQTAQGFEPIGGCGRVVPMSHAGGDYAYWLGLDTSQWPDLVRVVAHGLIAVAVIMPWLPLALVLLGVAISCYRIRAQRLNAVS